MSLRSASAVLDRLDLRSTSARRAVITAVLSRSQPFTARELVARLARRGIGRATVFRTLDLLVRAGVLSRIHGIEGGERCFHYTRCAPEHHHHLVCRACGKVEEIDARRLDARLDSVARGHGFRALSHAVEIQGLCQDCH